MSKVALLIPCYRDPAYRFAVSLVPMLTHTARARPDLELRSFWTQGSMPAVARNNLLSSAIEWGADHALFMDSDHTFSADALLRLLSHGLEVVGTNPARRSDPTGPTAANIGPDGAEIPVWTTHEAAKAGTVERVARIGFGLVLLALSIVPKLKAHADAAGVPFWPLFHFGMSEDGRKISGEDYYFCERLEQAGIAVHVDHGLSWAVGHIHERVLFPADTEAARLLHKARPR